MAEPAAPSRDPDLVLVSGSDMPVVDSESPLIIRELERLGVAAEVREWTEPGGWDRVPLVVCRSTWDYFHRPREFLRWVDEVAEVTHLENPATLLRWNAHKSYLLDLQRAGIPIVPTQLVGQGAGERECAQALQEVSEAVVKPAIGGGALGARRGSGREATMAAHLWSLTANGDALVQPFMASVPDHGEIALIYFDGRFSHAVRKVPAPGDFRVHQHHGGRVVDHAPSALERERAEDVLRAIPDESLYARIDLVESPEGPLVMEAELIEPFLFLGAAPGATARLAQALIARL